MTHTQPIKRVPTISAVFFGSAHAGKSTLIGYLADKLCSDVSAETVNTKLKEQYSSRYDRAQYYAYVVDTGRDEITRATEHRALGTTKRIHFKRIPNVKLSHDDIQNAAVLLVDTPGSFQQYRERIKGMSFGEIGVFVVEARMLEKISCKGPNLQDVVEFLSPLQSWMSLSTKPEALVVLSKADTATVSQSSLLDAWHVVRDRHLPQNATTLMTVITEIHVDERRDRNVYTEVVDSNPGHQETLWSAIRHGATAIIKRRGHTIDVEEDVFIANRKFANVEGIGPVLQGKVISGKFSVGDEIRVLPTWQEAKDIQPDGTTAIIKSLRWVDGDLVDVIAKGDMAGVALRGKKGRSLRITRGTIAISLQTRYALGSCMEIEFEENRTLPTLRILQEYGIVWFGKVIWLNAIYVSERTLVAELKEADTQVLVAPLIKETQHFLFGEVVMGVGRKMQDLTKARLKRLGYVEEIRLGNDIFSFADSSSQRPAWSDKVRKYVFSLGGRGAPNVGILSWREA